jgi:hypothetical protein
VTAALFAAMALCASLCAPLTFLQFAPDTLHLPFGYAVYVCAGKTVTDRLGLVWQSPQLETDYPERLFGGQMACGVLLWHPRLSQRGGVVWSP